MIHNGVVYCDFCSKRAQEVKLICRGQNQSTICNECVDECIDMLVNEGIIRNIRRK